MRLGRDVGRKHVGAGDAPGLALGGGFVKSCLLSCLTRLDRRRLGEEVFYAEYVASYLYTGRLDRLLPRLLKSPPPAGTLEIMVHPGIPEESRNPGLGNAELERYLASEDRRAEMEACIAARRLVSGWRLTTFARLARERENRP